MRAAIVGSGMVVDYSSFVAEIKKCDIIICADGGIKHLINVDIPPHIFIGDFDSCNREEVKNHPILNNSKIQIYNSEKDDTDMQLCIDYAVDNGFDEIIMFAALGGRIDHELSNIFHLKYILDKGMSGVIHSENNIIYITDNYLKIPRKEKYKLSVIPLTNVAEGVTLKGTYYPLENYTLFQGSSLGISNEFTSEYAEISVNRGILLVILSKDTLN